jgi:RNA:NAD 2'-phosphotransferase (TPT1/KptA family)
LAYPIALDRILAEGLRPMGRTHVRLSGDIDTAQKVGSRRGAPVILRVDAAAMGEAGFRFFRSSNGVWLVDKVPARYLDVTGAATISPKHTPCFVLTIVYSPDSSWPENPKYST